MVARALDSFFSRSDALSRLQDHAERLQRLQRLVEAGLPLATRGAVRVANFQEGELTLHVTSPALATRLKMSLNGLQTNLVAAGEPVGLIKVKVRTTPFVGLELPEDVEARPIGAGGKAALLALSEQLRSEDPLAAALRRMVKHSA
ncbi:MAG: hypothetical protein CGU28_03870 [Candidatus Dactylopiibacterium carminicum]|nr:MAG: hypothetical protein CGU28_03870 [Candidatus Dactylopiibacterium carminicum]